MVSYHHLFGIWFNHPSWSAVRWQPIAGEVGIKVSLLASSLLLASCVSVQLCDTWLRLQLTYIASCWGIKLYSLTAAVLSSSCWRCLFTLYFAIFKALITVHTVQIFHCMIRLINQTSNSNATWTRHESGAGAMPKCGRRRRRHTALVWRPFVVVFSMPSYSLRCLCRKYRHLAVFHLFLGGKIFICHTWKLVITLILVNCCTELSLVEFSLWRY